MTDNEIRRTMAPGCLRTARRYCSAVLVMVVILVLACRATAQYCIGDCDGDGRVTVNELITGVNVGLGVDELDACRSIDCNARFPGILIPINCMVAAVSNALEGCGSPANCTVHTQGGTTVITRTWPQ